MVNLQEAIVKAKNEVEDSIFTGIAYDLPDAYVVKLIPSNTDETEIPLDPFYSVDKNTGEVDQYPITVENLDAFLDLSPIEGIPENLIDKDDLFKEAL